MPLYIPPVPVLSSLVPSEPFGLAQQVNGSVHFNKIFSPGIVNASAINFFFANSNSSSAGASCSFTAGIYSQINNSSLSRLSSGSLSFFYNSTGGASRSYTNFSGTRLFSMPMNANLYRGNYFFAFAASIATALTSGSFSFIVNAFNATLNNSASIGGDYNIPAAYGALASASLPATLHTSQLVRSSNVAMRSPFVSFI